MCTQRFELKHKPLGLILRIGMDLHTVQDPNNVEIFQNIFTKYL